MDLILTAITLDEDTRLEGQNIVETITFAFIMFCQQKREGVSC